jgi:hypothetical protein
MVVLLDSCSNRSTPSFSSPADAGEDRSGGWKSLNVLHSLFYFRLVPLSLSQGFSSGIRVEVGHA